MTGGSPRRVRVAQSIRHSLVELIEREVSDPRVAKAGLLSVTKVEMNRDMSVAMVYISFVGGPEGSAAKAIAALQGAAGFLRGPLGRHLGMAKVPTLRFNHDQSVEFQAKVTEIVRDDERRGAEDAKPPGANDSSTPEGEGK